VVVGGLLRNWRLAGASHRGGYLDCYLRWWRRIQEFAADSDRPISPFQQGPNLEACKASRVIGLAAVVTGACAPSDSGNGMVARAKPAATSPELNPILVRYGNVPLIE
jgi:hypothetical protein